MLISNPMFNKEIVIKAKNTLSARIKSGEIVYKVGNAHHLWKGNRDRAQTIRTRLYHPWIKPILEHHKFKCCMCGDGGRLEVHHEKIPFRDIIKCLLPNNSLEELSIDEFELFIETVIKYHIENNVEGKPYCVKCHKKVDKWRK